ncbi:MAG: hypothetical protein HC896_05520 [Bacteroidales bacterium]|nr:hypothetical protein [Bacteroidales bacterium]
MVSISVSAAYAYYKVQTAVPQYTVSSILLIQQEDRLDPQAILGLGLVGKQSQQVNNEIGILRSSALIERTIDKLNFLTSYYKPGQFYDTEIYKNTPFSIQLDLFSPQVINTPFFVEAKNDSLFRVTATAEYATVYSYLEESVAGSITNLAFDTLVKSGDTVHNAYLSFIFRANSTLQPEPVYFVNQTKRNLVKTYQNLAVQELPSSTMLRISYTGSSIEKSVDFLNALAHEYLAKGIEHKNQVAINTINYIDELLVEVTDSLIYSENELETFRKRKQVLNLDYQSQQLFSLLKETEEQKAQLKLKEKYYMYLIGLVQDNKKLGEIVIPSTMGINDAVLGTLINELTTFTESCLKWNSTP